MLIRLVILIPASIAIIMHNAPILEAWTLSPFDAYAWIYFTLWALVQIICSESHQLSLPRLIGAIAIDLLGILSGINALHHLALALLILSVGAQKHSTIRLISSLPWMPFFGFFLHAALHLPPVAVTSLRLVGLMLLILFLIRNSIPRNYKNEYN